MIELFKSTPTKGHTMARNTGTDYRGFYIVKHEAPNPDDTYFSVVLAGRVHIARSMPQIMADIDKWEDS